MKTYYGVYENNTLTLRSGDVLTCIPYTFNKSIIEGKEGFFNIQEIYKNGYSIESFLLKEDLSEYDQFTLNNYLDEIDDENEINCEF